CQKNPRSDASRINAGVGRGIGTFGFRIPDNEFCIALARAFGAPYTATSANKAGEQPLTTVEEILAQLGEGRRGIDLAIDAGSLPPSEPSSVIDLSQSSPRILRAGAVSVAAIEAVIAQAAG